MSNVWVYPGELPLPQERSAKSSPLPLGAIAGAILIALWFGGNGFAMRLAVPVVAVAVGLVLYLRQPILYVQYTLWVWFLTPLLRRLVDLHFGWTDPNIILLSPLLVSALAGLSLLRQDTNARPGIPVGFALCGGAILYGFVVGCLLNPSAELLYGLLNWLCPLLFGLHIYRNWPRYEIYRDVIGRCFLRGALLMGIYGVYQFFSPPAWDRLWLEGARAASTGTSFGMPEPLLIRVWSTLNAPGPFANVMMVALLFLFVVRSPLKLPASIAGYTSFLLSVVRTAWLSWIIGLVWILKKSSPRVILRIFLSGIVLLVCLVPFLSDQRISDVVSDRVKTFTSLRSDESFEDRSDMYRILINDAIESPFGHGLKNLETSHGMAVDSGILATIFSLGWMGAFFFAAGVACLLITKTSWPPSDQFPAVGKAITIALLAQIVGGNIFVSVTGAMFWMAIGMFLASAKYYSENKEQASA
ncbi:MAG TPA: O-antigen ligase family protein [Terriglobales bacterium]|nr:O-antigen ligase family protein [Terriglobales bacterium]